MKKVARIILLPGTGTCQCQYWIVMMRRSLWSITNAGLSVVVVCRTILLNSSLFGLYHQDGVLHSLDYSLHSDTRVPPRQEHIAWYDADTINTTWHPAWIGEKKRVDKELDKYSRWKLIEDSFLHDHGTVNKSLEMLGFLRIPKTGSTSILKWAEHATRKGPHYDCFFGPRHFDFPPTFFHKKNFLDCPHRTYERTVFQWAHSILPTLVRDPNKFTQKFSLQMFTIVRDPFDRLVSYFHYVRRIYPAWSHMSTPEQNVTILANNLTAWMELLATQPPKAFHLPYQKSAMMDVDFSLATRAIQGPSPRVYTVIQQCFEASVLLLCEAFPRFFSLEATLKFLNSSKTQHNTKSRFQSQQLQEDWNQTQLREKAKLWFEKDFQFYDAVVEQFRSQLMASQVDRHIVQDCLERLEQRV